jgi:hypothetical protein
MCYYYYYSLYMYYDCDYDSDEFCFCFCVWPFELLLFLADFVALNSQNLDFQLTCCDGSFESNHQKEKKDREKSWH